MARQTKTVLAAVAIVLVAGFLAFAVVCCLSAQRELEYIERMEQDGWAFVHSVAEAFSGGDRQQLSELCLPELQDEVIGNSQAYGELDLEFDAFLYRGHSMRRLNDWPGIFILRYKLLGAVPEALADTIIVKTDEEGQHYVFQTVSVLYDEAAARWTCLSFDYGLYEFWGPGNGLDW